MTPRALADALRTARLARGWSQERVAFEAGTNQRHIWRIESGADVRLSTLLRVCDVLGVGLYVTCDVEGQRHVA